MIIKEDIPQLICDIIIIALAAAWLSLNMFTLTVLILTMLTN